MRIVIQTIDLRYAIDKKALSALIRKVLCGESAAGWGIDIIYCRDREMISLNREFKSKSISTDVLAFDLRDPLEPNYLGEIYVNLQMARLQAARFKVSYMEEVRRLTVHGVLHLLGYRDSTSESKARMWKRQEGYLFNGKKRR